MDNFEVIKMLMFKNNENFDLKCKSSGDKLDISQLQAGDLILRRAIDIKCRIFHAGIFCGQNDVIQFNRAEEVNQKSKSGLCSSSQSNCLISSPQNGLVDKISVKNFILDKEFLVFRLKNGPPADLAERINQAMDEDKKYHLWTNNCLHFALRLLGCIPGPMPESLPDTDEEWGEAIALTNQTLEKIKQY